MRETFDALFWWLSQPEAVLWWATVILIGLAAFPLAFRFFRFLPDRGYAFAKVFGMVILAYALWIGGYAPILPFHQTTIIALLLVMALASAAAVWRGRSEIGAHL